MSETLWIAFGVLATAYVAYETIQGWQTGKIRLRSFEARRDDNPAMYWLLMAFYGLSWSAFCSPSWASTASH